MHDAHIADSQTSYLKGTNFRRVLNLAVFADRTSPAIFNPIEGFSRDVINVLRNAIGHVGVGPCLVSVQER